MTHVSTDVDLISDVTVPAREARFIEASSGQLLSVVDLEGRQVGDLVALRLDRPDEYLSPAHTCSSLGKLVPAVGDALLSNHRTPLLRVLRDDVGRHDLVVPCCDPERYALDYGAVGHDSCLESLRMALAEHDAARELSGEWAVNVFMNNIIRPDGTIETRAPEHRAGSTITFELLEDLLVGLSACPQDLSPVNDFNPTSMALRLWQRKS